MQGQDAKPKRPPANWIARKEWERIQRLAEMALTMLADSSTEDLATQHIPKVRDSVDLLNELAKTVTLNAEERN